MLRKKKRMKGGALPCIPCGIAGYQVLSGAGFMGLAGLSYSKLKRKSRRKSRRKSHKKSGKKKGGGKVPSKKPKKKNSTTFKKEQQKESKDYYRCLKTAKTTKDKHNLVKSLKKCGDKRSRKIKQLKQKYPNAWKKFLNNNGY